MNGWLLDTNVVASLAAADGAPSVKAWAGTQDESRLYLSVITLAEYDKGVHQLSEDDPRRARYAANRDAIENRFRRRILPLSDSVVRRWGAIAGRVRRDTGHPPPVIDTLLAATALRSEPLPGYPQLKGCGAVGRCDLQPLARRREGFPYRGSVIVSAIASRPPAHWLVKSEPTKYSFDDLVRDGRTVWDGVRNAQAAIFLKTMKVGDQVLVYHSQVGLAVVGVAEVVREAFPDPSDPAGRFVAVELAPVRALKNPVTLARMKAEPALSGMAMFRQFRLSVTPIAPDEWTIIMRLSETACAT